MAKRARDKRGRFLKGSTAKRRRRRKSNPPPVAKTRRRRPQSAGPRKRTRRQTRSNPRMPRLLSTITDGLVDGLTVSAAQGVTRVVPGLFKIPLAGATGIAIQAATAALLGMASEYLLGGETARMVTAGAFAVPIQSAAMMYGSTVPLVPKMFLPTLSSYSRPVRTVRMLPKSQMASYPRPALAGFKYGQGYAQAGTQGYDYAAGIFM